VFITLEGPEGGGKTLAAAFLVEWLRTSGRSVLALREPGGTPLGEAVRSLILHGPEQPLPVASLLLFSAARAELVGRLVAPALAAGEIVVCDRFTDSTLAYQGYGEGLPLASVEQANALATGGLRPDITILLDLEPAVGLARRAASGQWDQMDGRALDFHTRVRAGFRELAAADPARWRIVDASAPPATVQQEVLAALTAHPRWDGRAH
jgi:dTMP kinase